MRRVGVFSVTVVLVSLCAITPGPASAIPGDPCPAAAPIDGEVDVAAVDETAADAERNHLEGDIGATAVDYLSPPGEPLDLSIAAAVSPSGLDPAVPVTATEIDRSTLVSLRRVADVIGCVDEGAGGWVEVQLTDNRLSYTGDPSTDPDGVNIANGYLLVTITRLRTSRPIVEYSVSGPAPVVPPEAPPPPTVDPIEATPTFVG